MNKIPLCSVNIDSLMANINNIVCGLLDLCIGILLRVRDLSKISSFGVIVYRNFSTVINSACILKKLRAIGFGSVIALWRSVE